MLNIVSTTQLCETILTIEQRISCSPNRWNCYFIKNTCIWVVQCIKKRSRCGAKISLALVGHQRLQLLTENWRFKFERDSLAALSVSPKSIQTIWNERFWAWTAWPLDKFRKTWVFFKNNYHWGQARTIWIWNKITTSRHAFSFDRRHKRAFGTEVDSSNIITKIYIISEGAYYNFVFINNELNDYWCRTTDWFNFAFAWNIQTSSDLLGTAI